MADLIPDPEPPSPADATREFAGADLLRMRDPWAEMLDVANLTPTRVVEIQKAARAGEFVEFLEFAEQILERDPNASSHFATLRTDVHGLPVQVHAASDDARDQEIAEWVRVNVVDQEAFSRLRWDLLDGAWRGFSVVELMWDPPNDWAVDYKWRQPSWFTFDRATGSRLMLRSRTGRADGFGNLDMGDELVPGKWLCFAPGYKSGLVVRSGLVWSVMGLHLIASFALRYWIALAEGHGRPARYAILPETASADQWDATKRALAAMGYNASAVFQAGTEIVFPDANIEGHADFHRTLNDWIGQQIALTILGSNMMNEQGGSFAKATALGDRLDNRVKWFVQRLDACINEQLIKLVCKIQFGELDAYPAVHAITDEPEDSAAIALSFLNVAKAIGKPLPVRESELRNRLGFSDPEEGDRLAGGDTWTAEGKPEREDLDAEQELAEAAVVGVPGDGDGDGDGE